jgi:GrpB-like predicted nucleotidyltransferase (UPF0157 family)
VHTHTFTDERGGTRVADAVEFDVPLAWLAGPLVVRDVRRIFAYRTAVLMKLFGSPASIEIAGYDPQWPHLFTQAAARIREALGARALRIEHAGSTSVPGLAAKPVVDIVLEVKNSADEASFVPPLEAAGYTLRIREPEWYEHRLLEGAIAGRSINLHVFSDGCPEIARMMLFRDWLRENPGDRALYERTKRELAQKTWARVQDYADAKTRVVNEIMARAERSG